MNQNWRRTMFRLAAVFLLALALPAQYEEEPPDEGTTGRCAGCGMNLAGSVGGAVGEQWAFMPSTYSRPGQCYDGFNGRFCTYRGCSFRGRLKFTFHNVIGSSGGSRQWHIANQSGLIGRGQSSGWIAISYKVGCGEENPPMGRAFNGYAPNQQTSGFAFKCEPCVVGDVKAGPTDG